MSFLDSLGVTVSGMLVVFIALIFLALIILIMTKIIAKAYKSGQAYNDAPPVNKTSGNPTVVSQNPPNRAAGTVDLINVGDRDAAVIMAIVSYNTGIPLNQLRFISIKEL